MRCLSHCKCHPARCPVFQLTSELELSSQQQSRLNEVIRAITQVWRHILLITLVKMCQHYHYD